MPVNVRWITVGGEPKVKLTLPGGIVTTLTHTQAVGLAYMLRRVALAAPPPGLDTEIDEN
jgi:hypothetical protein